jgi:hypothetical protein
LEVDEHGLFTLIKERSFTLNLSLQLYVLLNKEEETAFIFGNSIPKSSDNYQKIIDLAQIIIHNVTGLPFEYYS